ncbi:MAG: stage II sporulation protein R [Oscillospiraceae bacterium]|nr:stage II sporulation protein R [Oscillospiraceae bacterium]
MKKFAVSFLLLLGAVLCSAAGVFITFSESCENVCEKVLRLHIPANSNSAEDQEIKLKLRDYLLNEFSGEIDECGDVFEAEQKARELLPEIEQKCSEFLSDNGFSYGAKAELVSMYFTTREYDRLILPAGEYKALRVTLGSGSGENWWCVFFPQLCVPAVSEKSEQQSDASEQILDSFGKPQGVTVKFAVYEFFSRLFSGE